MVVNEVKRRCSVDEAVLNVKVVVEMAAKSGRPYWRRGEGKTLKEALVALFAGGKRGGGKMDSEKKGAVKDSLCWVELGLKERGPSKFVAKKKDSAMDAEFLGKSGKKKLIVKKKKRS